MTRHGSINDSASLLIPKNSLYQWNWKKKKRCPIDVQGLLKQLPYDQTVPFSRYMAPELKLFPFDKIYRENQSSDGQTEAMKI
jgi:translation initiation factor 2-alpha kinase 4